uniref:HTH cro/C1-type domain-containing protein n=1 Tax=Hemiselmis tepida TaxID=464990 RepID=A0A7S0VNU5_9CRYP|mmetsp:Transcript_21781/g.55000  ORF Transcript_21781/g.55000 Transcript_21781/m.55000 type:complete len:124 (+) Transcript_21781:56-427(+)
MAHIQQDWEPVVLRKNPTSGGGGAGAGPKGGSSKQTGAGVDIRKLEDEEGEGSMKLPTVSMDLRLAIAQARQAKGLSQKDLATKLMIPAKTIQDYEAGKAIPNNALIAKIERALGCKLPRQKK